MYIIKARSVKPITKYFVVKENKQQTSNYPFNTIAQDLQQEKQRKLTMTQRYYYYEHLADYAEIKEKGLKSRGEIHGDPDDFENFSSKEFLEEILPSLPIPPNGRVLELGCGTGPGACFLAQKGFQVTGIDLIPDAIEKAKENAKELGLDIQYEVMDVCNISTPDAPFDLIVDSYCTQSIAIQEDRKRMFDGIKEHLALNGYFILSCCVLESHRLTPELTIQDNKTGKTYIRFDRNGLFDPKTEICYNLWRKREYLPNANPQDFDGTLCIDGQWYIHQRLYRTAESLRHELEQNGFKVLSQSGEILENAVCMLA